MHETILGEGYTLCRGHIKLRATSYELRATSYELGVENKQRDIRLSLYFFNHVVPKWNG